MGTPLRGRYASVKLGSNLVANGRRWTLDIRLDEIDVSVFGSVWKKSMTGMQSWAGTLESLYDPADTQQDALADAALSATKITNIRFYIDSTSYWTPDITNDSDAGCYVSGMPITHEHAGVAAVTYNIVGYGQLTLV